MMRLGIGTFIIVTGVALTAGSKILFKFLTRNHIHVNIEMELTVKKKKKTGSTQGSVTVMQNF